MALQTKVPTYTRVRYFKGLFLYAPDFDAESDFHVATRRHLNYLLFQPGVLLLGETDLEDNQGPFAVRADGSTAVTVSAGSAIVPDGDVRQQQHEVHLDAATTLNLSSTNVGALDGEKVFVTIGFDEEDVYSGLSSDGTSLTTE
ncbi:MAG: hypothetical protein GY722_29285, partial [bacterium]|nr:hypothetical protein [bacterium]